MSFVEATVLDGSTGDTGRVPAMKSADDEATRRVAASSGRVSSVDNKRASAIKSNAMRDWTI